MNAKNTAAFEVMNIALDALDLASEAGLSTHAYRNLMRDIAKEAQRRIRVEARTYRPRRTR